jgi:hypothetical protein
MKQIFVLNDWMAFLYHRHRHINTRHVKIIYVAVRVILNYLVFVRFFTLSFPLTFPSIF